MSKPLQIADDIVPINEFKTHASKLIRKMHESGRPMVITQNGRPSAVLVSPQEFDDLTYRNSFQKAVLAGIDDSENGRTHTSAEVRKFITARFKK